MLLFLLFVVFIHYYSTNKKREREKKTNTQTVSRILKIEFVHRVYFSFPENFTYVSTADDNQPLIVHYIYCLQMYFASVVKSKFTRIRN